MQLTHLLTVHTWHHFGAHSQFEILALVALCGQRALQPDLRKTDKAYAMIHTEMLCLIQFLPKI